VIKSSSVMIAAGWYSVRPPQPPLPMGAVRASSLADFTFQPTRWLYFSTNSLIS
jgi:hypothetical protein